MDILNAVIQVLKEHDRPFHFKDIARQISERKLVDKAHQTVETLVNAKVGIDIKTAEKENRPPRFQKLPNGFIALAGSALDRDAPDDGDGFDDDEPELPETPRDAHADDRADSRHESYPDPGAPSLPNSAAYHDDPLDDVDDLPDEGDVYDRIQDHNHKIAKDFARYLNGVDFATFERHINQVIRSFPIKRSTIVNRRKDGGMDFAINLGFMRNNLNLLIAVRRWGTRRSVTMEDVNETFERMKVHGFNACIYVATGDFDNGVYDFADGFKDFPFFLVNGERLAWIMLERKMIREGEQVSVFQFEDRPPLRPPHRPERSEQRQRESYPPRDHRPRSAPYIPPLPPQPPA